MCYTIRDHHHQDTHHTLALQKQNKTKKEKEHVHTSHQPNTQIYRFWLPRCHDIVSIMALLNS
jgi:hypothetical protein